MDSITVGTCGYSSYDPPEGWKDDYESKLAAYAATFDGVELNRTFYSLPQVSTAERWRREARDVNPDFAFVVKAWQAITHPISSPTWRDHDDDLSADERDAVEMFQPNQTVIDAWRQTRARAKALDAEIALLQTPPRFDCSVEHEQRLRQFCDGINRGGLTLAWEPRGDWTDHPDRIAALCAELDLVHVTDLLREEPVETTDVAYTRLHGLNDDRYDYDYDYSDDELHDLVDRLTALTAEATDVYCLFNNYGMYANATTLIELLD